MSELKKLDNPYSIFLTSRIEADIHELVVEGEIPDINGMFCTVGPEPLFVPRADTIHPPIHGDGLMSAVYLSDGKASYKSRYVQTEKYKLEKAAGRSLFGTYRNPWTDDPLTKGVNPTTANTTMYRHAGVFQVLKEDSLPFEIALDTLATVGELSFDGADLPGPNMSAHPKTCGETGEMFNVGTMVGGPGSEDYVVYSFDAQGKIEKSEVFKGPYACMMHDFMITRDYIVIPFFPSLCDVDRMKQGGAVWEWDPTGKSSIALIPRNGSVNAIKWIPIDETFYCIHYFNAYSEGNIITADVVKMNYNLLFPAKDAPPMPVKLQAFRWSIDAEAGTMTQNPIFDSPTEFPKIDERLTGLKHQYGYSPILDIHKPATGFFGFNSLARTNMDTGEQDIYYIGENAEPGEPIFIPRSKNSPEGDGYLVGYIFYPQENRTEFIILDAEHLPNGPIAIIKIPYLIPQKVHGGWFSE